MASFAVLSLRSFSVRSGVRCSRKARHYAVPGQLLFGGGRKIVGGLTFDILSVQSIYSSRQLLV
jgi:hypothetical protein